MASTGGRIEAPPTQYSKFYFQWQLTGQNEDGNYTTINWQAGINIWSGGWFGTNSIKIFGVYINGSGNLGSGTWSNISGNGDHQLLSGSMTIGHNYDGGKAFGVSLNGWITGDGNRDTSGSWELPWLYQAIDFTSIQFGNVTDVGFNAYAAVNRYANLLQINVNNAGFVTYQDGGYWDKTAQIGGTGNQMASGKMYPVVLRIRRNSNGWVTDSGTYYVTTNSQNNFFDMEF